jgi:hypothetical protein
VRHPLPRIETAFLDHHDADAPDDPERGRAARVSSLVPGVPVSIGPVTRHGILSAVSLIPLRLTPLGIRLVALLWALGLGQASVAGNPAAREEGSPPDNAVQTATTNRLQSGSPDSVARLVKTWHLRSHRRSHVFPRFSSGDDPNDNETSDDPNDDDDAWDDLNGYDDTDVPIITWLWESLPHLNAPECAPLAWTAPTSPPFLTLQRLRC